MNPSTPVMLDDVEVDALRIGLALLDDEVQGGTMSPTPPTTNPPDKECGRPHSKRATASEDRKAALYMKAQRLAIARLAKKLRAVA